MINRDGPGRRRARCSGDTGGRSVSASTLKRKAVRQRTTLGEEFVLFRDGAGRFGMVELHCSHRGTSLDYRPRRRTRHPLLLPRLALRRERPLSGQPAEPADSTFKDRIRHPAFTAQEIGGFIFAYIGPAPAPLLPRYDLLLEENGTRMIGAGTEYCNWLQRADNSVDQTHLVALHAPEYPEMALKRPEIGWEKPPTAPRSPCTCRECPSPDIRTGVFPSHTRHTTARKGRIPDHAIRFRVPTDDTKTTTFWLRFTPNDEADRGKPLVLKSSASKMTSQEFTRGSTTAGGASPRTIKTASRRKARG